MGDIGRGRSGSAAWEGLLCTLSFYALILGAFETSQSDVRTGILGAKLLWNLGELLYDLRNLPFLTISRVFFEKTKAVILWWNLGFLLTLWKS